MRLLLVLRDNMQTSQPFLFSRYWREKPKETPRSDQRFQKCKVFVTAATAVARQAIDIKNTEETINVPEI
jgi:hypothetical protein